MQRNNKVYKKLCELQNYVVARIWTHMNSAVFYKAYSYYTISFDYNWGISWLLLKIMPFNSCVKEFVIFWGCNLNFLSRYYYKIMYVFMLKIPVVSMSKLSAPWPHLGLR